MTSPFGGSVVLGPCLPKVSAWWIKVLMPSPSHQLLLPLGMLPLGVFIIFLQMLHCPVVSGMVSWSGAWGRYHLGLLSFSCQISAPGCYHVGRSFLQTPRLLKFQLVSLVKMIIAPKSTPGTRCWVRRASSLHSDHTGLSDRCIEPNSPISCYRFSLPLGESRHPFLPVGTNPGIRKDEFMLNLT